ncbi:MAG: dockerin type I repeat-containing protein [Ruminococcus sp.]|nr:dockerin type I repeat-containing protein [Ruminococcus sp.]
MNKAFCVFVGFVLAAVAAASCLTVSALTYVKGDADGDGEITSIDVTTAQRVIAGILPDTGGLIAQRADVTCDGLSLPDVTAIQRYLAGLADGYHVGETIVIPSVDPTEDNQLPIMR